jgi:plastocyanin
MLGPLFSKAPRTALAALLLAIALIAPGCADDADSTPVDPSQQIQKDAQFHEIVEVDANGFTPAKARVLVGGDVTFINRDTDPRNYHSAESEGLFKPTKFYDEDTSFDTHSLTWNEPYTVVLHKPGTYEYVCTFHKDMKGIIDVFTRTPELAPK